MSTEIWLSGLGAAIITIVLSKICEWNRFRKSRKALYQAILAECRYNLGIVNEMLAGMLKGATFKRMSVEFFKEMRLQAIQYSIDKKVLSSLSRAIVDIELYNREADCIITGGGGAVVYAGMVGANNVCVMKNSSAPNLTQTVTAACKGVTDSLNNVVEVVHEIDESADDED